MLVPTSIQRLPDSRGCFNGALLFGATVSQIASTLAQVTRVKMLGEAHYYVGQLVPLNTGRRFIVRRDDIKTSTVNNFLYQSTPISTQLGLVIQYVTRNFSNALPVTLDVELRDTAGNSYTGTVLDVGIRMAETELQSDPNTALMAFSGAELISAPSNPTPDPPRPLFVPSANRGQLLNVKITAGNCLVLGCHIYDLYQPEITP
jgi:hypothetical protein